MKKFIIWALLILFLILCCYIYWKYSYTFSEGYRVGLLQKFSYKGTIFKTYEGEMILSSVESNRNVSLASEKFFFSVADKDVAASFAKLEGYMIVVHYREKNGTLFWRGETRYLVDSVTVKK